MSNLQLKLNNTEWKEFLVEDVFEEVASSPYSLDYNAIPSSIKSKADIAYVTRSNLNNGISHFIGDMTSKEIPPLTSNCITIGLDTATVKYQNTTFYTGQNIHIVRDKRLNKLNALFLIPLIEKSLERFSWGGFSATLTRFRKTRILLPSLNNQPDWGFMEDFMSLIKAKVVPKKKVIQNKIKDWRELNEVVWEERKLEQIFYIKSGRRLTKSNMKTGNIPFIGATDSNNGMTNYVSNVNDSLDSNVLGVNYNGSVVENFYHPYQCVFSDDVKRFSFKNHDGNKYTYLFFKTIILKQKEKYAYGYKFNTKRMERQTVMVPINSNGNIDWLFIEQYMKRIENDILSKIKQSDLKNHTY